MLSVTVSWREPLRERIFAMSKSVQSFPKHRRPREKLAANGVTSLTELELIMVLIGSGNAERRVQDIARDVRSVLKQTPGTIDIKSLSAISGIGLARSTCLAAAIELARRQEETRKVQVCGADDILPLVLEYVHRSQECFIAVSLNGNHEVIRSRLITIGLANFCQVHPREVFADAVTDRATSIVVAHNHPSGSLEPSSEDIDVTVRLARAGELLGIRLLDHVVFSRCGHHSLLSSHPSIFRFPSTDTGNAVVMEASNETYESFHGEHL